MTTTERALSVPDVADLAAVADLATVTVAVIDHREVVHAGVAAWLHDVDPPVRLAGGFRTAEEFLVHHPDADAGIDAVVFDPDRDGRLEFDALHSLCQRGHRVIVFSDLAADEVILTCLDMGAMTFLAKSEGRDHLVEAVRDVGAAIPYSGPRMSRALRNDGLLGRINLSGREKEVLIAWFQTESKEAVGKRLFIAPTTVRTHLQRARAKYAAVGRPAPTKSALLARAIEDGILSLSDL